MRSCLYIETVSSEQDPRLSPLVNTAKFWSWQIHFPSQCSGLRKRHTGCSYYSRSPALEVQLQTIALDQIVVQFIALLEAEVLILYSATIHMIILDLFRPYIAENEQHGYHAYVPESSSPRTIFAASVIQLKGMFYVSSTEPCSNSSTALLFKFAIDYTPAYWNLSLSGAMVFTVNAVLNDLEDPERKNYLAFCISMSQRLLQSYVYMIETIRAILAIATDKGVISSAEAICIDAESVALQRAKYTNRCKGGWVVAPTADDNVAGNITTLTERFETITLFGEFTEGIA